jgi:N-acetyl-gamma-glutamyl-phosphate reductase
MRAAVLGASGYAGTELLRLMQSHGELDVIFAGAESAAGSRIGEYVPSLAAAYATATFSAHEEVFTTDAEVVFCALPHGKSQSFVRRLRSEGRFVVDLGADFRLKSPADYEQWYHEAHEAPELIEHAVYALVERHRSELPGANLLAVPGCFPTATALALGPFVDEGWVQRSGIVVNALSGTSGAGRATSDRLHFSRLHANAEAYGLLNHRHTVEMQQELGVTLLFTPHLVPLSRGMLVTAYAPLVGAHSSAEARELLRDTYRNDPYLVVSDSAPTLKDPLGSNLCFVSAQIDERTGWLVAMSSLDNLTKGAAGQAIQAFNLAQGWPETLGLASVGVSP